MTVLTAVTLGSGTTAAGLSENATDDKELFVLRPLYTCKENSYYYIILSDCILSIQSHTRNYCTARKIRMYTMSIKQKIYEYPYLQSKNKSRNSIHIYHNFCK